ncbi:MAG: alpha-galactosidase [Prevotellaceae bacterium]|jgi:alpha-galactosidase|nr:alpha-galactosidase [Prevotellaceae bacterium]
MKNLVQWLYSTGIILLLTACNENVLVFGDWKIVCQSETNSIHIRKGSQPVCGNLYASYRLGDRLISSGDYSSRKYAVSQVSDLHGSGKVFTVTCQDDDLPTLRQSFFVYPEKDYILTEFTLEARDGEISVNYMAPVCIDSLEFVWNTGNSRALFIPFDNDCWIRYKSHQLIFDRLTAYEVTAVFDNISRKGLVLGSVEHDRWKSAVTMTGNGGNGLSSIVCYGGVADSLTRDSKPHGALSGKTVKSPKIMFGVFNDWRNGMEVYGEVNAAVAPPRAWNKAVPFGWNSWGVLQFKLTYQKAMEVSDYFKNHLQANGFLNPDKKVYIGLDSGWNSFSEEELKSFVQKCRENGQIAGIYWTPFTDWGKNPEATVHDAEQYKYKDIYVYTNGKPQLLDGAYAIDPTHPAVEMRMKKTADLFRRCGFEYVKMDFMTHGAMEGDRWHCPDIKTGIQAYNYGLQLLNRYFDDMYINFSIAPLFPAHYAQSRRIACDAWNKIKDTEYTMNALSYGWWLNKVYSYNDADHTVLRDATEGENRARVTSSVITGLYIVGDDFSEGGDHEAKERAKKYLTNPLINAIAVGKSFRPLEGDGEKSENQFVRTDDSSAYYVYFNYTDVSVEISIPLDRIGGNAVHKTEALDLWNNRKIDIKTKITVPEKDVLVIRL